MNLLIFRKSTNTNNFGARGYWGVNEATGEVWDWAMIHSADKGAYFDPWSRSYEILGLRLADRVPAAKLEEFLNVIRQDLQGALLKPLRQPKRKGNIFRHLLYKALKENGGYGTRYEHYPIAYTVKLWNVDSSQEAVYAAIEGEKPAMHEDLCWDADMEYQWAQEDLYRTLTDWDSYNSPSRAACTRFGIAYEKPLEHIRKRFKRRGSEYTSYPSKHPEFIRVKPYMDVTCDVKFTCEGRGGAHVCVTEFEGQALRGFDADNLFDPYYANLYSNAWCQRLLAMMHCWEDDLTSKSASEQMMYSMASRMEDRLNELNDESEQVAYWNSRDVLTV